MYKIYIPNDATVLDLLAAAEVYFELSPSRLFREVGRELLLNVGESDQTVLVVERKINDEIVQSKENKNDKKEDSQDNLFPEEDNADLVNATILCEAKNKT